MEEEEGKKNYLSGDGGDWQQIFSTPKNSGQKTIQYQDPRLVNKIINENCFDYLDTLSPDSFDILLTDPPYYLPVQHYIGRKGYKRTASDDSIPQGFFAGLFEKISKVMKPTSAWYIFCNGASYPMIYNAVRPFVRSVNVLVWDKLASKLGYTWRHQHELIIFATCEEYERIPTGEGDILKCRSVPEDRRIHPTQKPARLLEQILKKHGKGNLVLDPFAGSGSTGKAAVATGNHYHLIEMEKAYYDRIVV